MANTYYDMTGTLVLDKVTPVIKALFSVFGLQPDFPSEGKAFIKEIAESTNCTWPALIEDLKDLAKLNGIQLDAHDDAEDDANADVLYALATFYKQDDNHELANYIEHCSLEDDVSPADLVFLAQAFDDGHGLKQASWQGAWHSDTHRPGHFGGCGSFIGRHIEYFTNSTAAIDMAEAIDEALDSGSLEDAVTQVSSATSRILNGISNPDVRAQVIARLIQKLQP